MPSLIPNKRITISLFLTWVLVLLYDAIVVQTPKMACSWSILDFGVKRTKEHLFLKTTVFVFSCIWRELLEGNRVVGGALSGQGGGRRAREPESSVAQILRQAEDQDDQDEDRGYQVYDQQHSQAVNIPCQPSCSPCPCLEMRYCTLGHK